MLTTKNYSHFSSYYFFLQYLVFICNPVSAVSCCYLIYDSFLIYSTGQKFSDILLTIDKINRYFSLLSVCYANFVQKLVYDSDEAVVTGKIISLQYCILHSLTNRFIWSTCFCRRELILLLV